MKLDTQKPGLTALMRPYKAVLLKQLYFHTNHIRYEGKSSGYLWEWLLKNAEELGVDQMSRASVINGLNALVDEGILKFKEVTGKGGYRRIYSVAMTPAEFEGLIKNKIMNKLIEVFMADWWKLEAET